jgi:DNA ligase D
MSAPVVVEAAGREVTITNPDKVFFSKREETKLDLVRYYLSVRDPLMSTMADRPTLMHRFPDGAGGKSFFQKRVPSGAPDWLQTTLVTTPNGTTSNALVAADIAHLLWAVNLGCLGFHPWAYRATEPAFTDELRIDLDPQPGTDFDLAREVALETKKLLDELGIDSYPKTTGSKGIHIWIRLQSRWTSYEVRAACVALAREMERRRPDIVTAAWWKEQRGARILIDYNQNAPHKTVFGPWSVRPRVGAQVACPLLWSDVATVKPDELTIATVPMRLAERGDPWAALNNSPQDIEPLLAMSASDMASGLMDAPWPPQYPRQPNEPPRVAPSRARKPDG